MSIAIIEFFFEAFHILLVTHRDVYLTSSGLMYWYRDIRLSTLPHPDHDQRVGLHFLAVTLMEVMYYMSSAPEARRGLLSAVMRYRKECHYRRFIV